MEGRFCEREEQGTGYRKILSETECEGRSGGCEQKWGELVRDRICEAEEE